MTDVDCLGIWDLFENRSRRKFWSCCSAERMFSVSYQQPYLLDVCSCKAFFKFCGTADSHSRLCKKGGSVENTRLLAHAKMMLVPMNCFLCRVDYTLKENVFFFNFGRLFNILGLLWDLKSPYLGDFRKIWSKCCAT